MANANDLRKGMCIRYNSNPAIVLEVMHRTPGNLRAFVQVIIRYIGTGKSADIRFGSTDKVEQVDVDTQQSLLEHYGVTVTPTLVLVDGDGFPLGTPVIDLDHPDVTLDRLQRLVKKMVKP